MAKGKKTGGRNWKPGQSGNPKGGRKGSATFSELQFAFNKNYVEMAEVVQKYIEMSDKDLNKAIDRANNKRTKTPMREILAIKYISDITKRGHTAKLDIVLGVITGTYGDGIKEVQEYDLEKSNVLNEFFKYVDSDKYLKDTEKLSSGALFSFILRNTNMHPNKRKVIETVAKSLQRAELTKLELIDKRHVQETLSKISLILRDTVGRTNPRLLMDIMNRMHDDISDTWELPLSMYKIEEDRYSDTREKLPPKKNKRGRPKGVKDAKPRKKRGS